MKIALYYPWIYLTSGVEKVILELVKRGKHDYTLFTNHYDEKNTYPGFRKYKVIRLNNISVRRDLYSVLKASFIIGSQKIDLSGYDVLFVHSDGLGDLISLRNKNIPIVVFCHTPLRPVFDEYYRERAIQKRSVLSRLPFYLFSYLFKSLDQYIWKNSSYVFFNSKETQRRAKKGGLLRSLSDKHEILHPGVDWEASIPSRVHKPYFFLPGRIMWTKNIELAIRSFILFKDNNTKYSRFRLIIAGQVDAKSKTYLGRLKKIAKSREDIKFVISPTDTELRKLYSECWAVLLSSFNEDWGMTLIEGNAFGKPSVAVDRGGPKESQVQDKTGILVKPNISDFAKGFELIAKDVNKTRQMGKIARKLSKKYNWENFIVRIEEVLTRVTQ